MLQIELEGEWNRHQIKLRSREDETLREELFSIEDYEIRRAKVCITSMCADLSLDVGETRILQAAYRTFSFICCL